MKIIVDIICSKGLLDCEINNPRFETLFKSWIKKAKYVYFLSMLYFPAPKKYNAMKINMSSMGCDA